MLSVVSRYFGQVDASDSKRGYLCLIVGSASIESGGVTATSKVVGGERERRERVCVFLVGRVSSDSLSQLRYLTSYKLD